MLDVHDAAERARADDEPIRVACVGARVYFENHFCERSAHGYMVEWFDFDHDSAVFYNALIEFRPDITLIFRPELHAPRHLRMVPGLKVGYSTEPFPKVYEGRLLRSAETDRRLSVFEKIPFGEYHAIYHYDGNSRSFCEEQGWRFFDYRPLPINTDHFNPWNRPPARWDAVFVGKATQRRIALLGGLKDVNRPFLWIEHGVSGAELAQVFRQARCVLNVHADDLVGLEPRVYLAAACGVPVLSDPVGTGDVPFGRFVVFRDLKSMTFDMIDDCIRQVQSRGDAESYLRRELTARSGAALIRSILSKLLVTW